VGKKQTHRDRRLASVSDKYHTRKRKREAGRSREKGGRGPDVIEPLPVKSACPVSFWRTFLM